ncbi:hypothetical protein AU381_06665 [Sinorhizobium glycinis]|uniref:Uncharacterized protein n=1 Tax=Sinorhizobium glycinis TaxID=1472378 RepID=A0A178YJS7_9HYPH|nr:hypothetical protein AU381_06665 [Sinorhizobium glycinis]
MSVKNQGLRFLGYGDDARISVRVFAVVSVQDPVQYLGLQPLESTRLHFLAHEDPQGLRMIKGLARAMKMGFQIPPLVEMRDRGNRLAFVLCIGIEQLA